MHVDDGHRQKPIDFQRRHFQNGHLAAILDFWFPVPNFTLASNINFKLQWHNTSVYGQEPIDFQQRHFQIGFFGFQTLILVWPWISTPNLSGTILMYMCRSLLIFSNINFKMAAWRPYCFFCFRTLNLVWLWISTPNLSSTILIYIYTGWNLLIFKDVTFKMAA